MDDVLGNLTTSVNTLRKQIVGLEGEDDFDPDNVESGTTNSTSTWNQEYFKYIGLILLLPRYCRVPITYMRHSEYRALLFTKVCINGAYSFNKRPWKTLSFLIICKAS